MEDEEQLQEQEREDGGARARLDKWLWAARFFKARALATQAVDGGRVKVNGERVKSSREIRVGDRVALQLGEFEWEVEVTHLSAERGGVTVGGALYEETDESRDRRAIVIANRNSNSNSHPEPAWSRGNGGDAERNRAGGRRRSNNGRGASNRGATAAFLSPETSPSQLVAAVTGTANGGGRPAPASAPPRGDSNRKPRRRRRGRGGRVRGGGEAGGGQGGGGQQGSGTQGGGGGGQGGGQQP
jgi:ribosome-associated heat shock protein Hsp15